MGNIDNFDDQYFTDILLNLNRFVPEFTTESESDEQYLILFEFGEYFIAKQGDSQLIKRTAEFVNEALEKGSSITQELIALELFQQLYCFPELLEKLRNNLSNSSKTVLDFYHLQYDKSYPDKKP
jgi:hypothetical protein